ncbi:MAG: carbohydrate binding domain-containing protein [Phycisphaerae bacterium]
MCKRLIHLTSFVLVLVVFPPVTNAQVENLALNPSFEEDEVILNDQDWYQWCTWNPEDVTGSNVTIVDTEFIDGTRSLRVDPIGVENWHFVVANISFPLKLGTDFTATFWAKAEEPRPLGAQFKAADNSVSWGYADFELTTEWAEYTFTAQAESDEGKLEFFCAGVEVPHWLDFVYVYEGEYVAGIEPGASLREKATAPEPVDGSIHPDTWVNLSWKPGVNAVSHDVYIGDNLEDVNNGAEGTFVGNQSETFIVTGFPGFPYPDGLVPGTTYYWRIDEVNDADPNSPWKGDVWSFSIPPKTAYLPDPADAAEQVDPDVTLSWTAGFGAKLHTVYFGDNFDEVNNAAGGLPQGTATYTPGTLKLAKTYYWRIDEFDAFETYKGNVWSFTTQGAVGSPDPANGAVDVKRTQIITWLPSVFAASHQLYFGTDKDTVKNADTSSPEYKGTRDLGAESYDPGKLELGVTYYWRVDEVNDVNPDSPWPGILWSFTTAGFLVVDDFEGYNDLDPADPESNRIFNAWIDGYDDPTNGSLVGYDNPPFVEQTIVHGGDQSMPFFYDNSVGYSEATLTLTYPRDWTEDGVGTLSIWFRGNSDNAAETLYVTLNGSAVVNHDNPNASQITTWTQWDIDLQAFADQGVNLANVNTIVLGLGNKKNPVAGGSGVVYFDDIHLYPPPAEPAP